MRNKTSLKEVELREALRLLYANVSAGSFVSFLVSTSLVFGFEFDSEDQEYTDHKIIWWVLMMVFISLRHLDSVLYQKEVYKNLFSLQQDILRFTVFASMGASIWSAYALYFFPFSSPDELTVTIIVICGMAAGGANLWSAHQFTAVTYALIILGPLAVLLLLSEDSHQHLLGLIGLGFTFVMMLSAHKTSSFTKDAIHLKTQHLQLLRDMEKKVELRTQEIYRLSNIDPLTGLLNRNAFLKELNHMVAVNPSTSLALLFIDLDGFKQINDSMGHEVGDKVIKDTSSRIASLCKGSLLLCRWGGDEFLVVLNYESHEQTHHFAQQIITAVSSPHITKQSQTWIGATIGVALYPEHGTHHDSLIQNADMAMYHQKRVEKGQVGYFNESLRQRLIRERLLSDRLSTAIEENALRLVFQPILESQTGKVTGLEALLRWHLDGEEVAPVEFIPLAEQYGLIKTIGLWVIEQACLQSISLSKGSQPPSVSVNVSVIQLQDHNFASQVQSLLTRLQFDPSLLLIEITESVFATDQKTLLEQIQALQKLNIKISIDDFGTGYSSLSSMQNLGADIIKIDKSFINKIDSTGLSIIKAVMEIAHSMGLRVVAEGVETAEQEKILKDIGAHLLQGYHLCRPLEAEQLTEYLDSSTEQKI
ncbi:putative bifunctional diguanylate cyclase/phosphodiesterase [Marinomonas transparens]|uniref:EAL domain-containing protein n=1 Tax=Marinomonas transparens TaxID=2795388 RepID=A0A934N0Y5_9GAMM|nr:EAL domain-containing protein [Marinomonas transparens]MBJ7536123.1 EAL domain-containing protein [Marinomonas transparens]